MKKIIIFAIVISSNLLFGQKYSKEEISFINKGNINELLPIYQTTEEHQHSILLKNSHQVNPKNKHTKMLVDRMRLSLESTQGGVGIAAPQVGINRNVILVKRFDKIETPVEYFLNPKIIWKSEVLNLGPEGDLSIPVFRDHFYRSRIIQLEYQDFKGKLHQEIIEGFTAVIFQHEIDHLSGILITDKKENEKNIEYQKIYSYIRIQ